MIVHVFWTYRAGNEDDIAKRGLTEGREFDRGERGRVAHRPSLQLLSPLGIHGTHERRGAVYSGRLKRAVVALLTHCGR